MDVIFDIFCTNKLIILFDVRLIQDYISLLSSHKSELNNTVSQK
jgi:hypothetical protein